MGLIQEFKEFAVKGNAMDMAVGIIIGAAFNKVVTSLVGDIIMPPIGLAMGKVDFKDLKILMQKGVPAIKDAAGNVTTPEIAEVAVRYGAFVNETINFIIVAFSVFMIVKIMNRVIKARETIKVI